MLCIICKEREATVHLTQIVANKMQKVDLCEECAKQKGVNDPAGFSFADLLLGLGAAQEMDAAAGPSLQCPKCGFTQADFKKSGRLGCAACYTAFAEGLEGLLKTMHKGIRHAGKVPQALRRNRDLVDRLKVLQRALDKAIAEEDFEVAANLRDEIREARSQLEKPAAT
jgi:protein arginine kinase activator